jgi:GNAT superfamily N-acetyltransferase
MRTRPATNDDREFILGLADRLAIASLPPWRSAADVASGTRFRLQEALDQSEPSASFIIAEEDDATAVGFAWVHTIRDWYTLRDIAKIEEIAVVEDGRGAGSALMHAVESWARAHKCELLVLNVLKENDRARRLYERQGFVDEHTLMTKDLR